MVATEKADYEALIAAIAKRDRDAFRTLYDLSAPKLFGTILRIMRSKPAAEEILQDVFLRVWQNADSFSPQAGSARAWMNSIARNRSIDVLRQKSFVPLAGKDDEADLYERVAEDRDREADMINNASLRHCLQMIDEPARRCVLLAYYDGYSREELAQRYDRPVNTIKTWLHRSLSTLRACLDGSAMSNIEDVETAAEYVLGTLPPDERVAFSGRLRVDAAARAEVEAWEGRLAGLAERVPPIAPPPHIWAAIEQALDKAASGAPRLKVVQGGMLGEIPPRLMLSLQRWRAAAVVSTGLAAALLLYVGNREFGTSDAATYIAAVNRGGAEPALLVRVDMRTKSVLVRPLTAETPAGKSLELWYIDSGKPPRSMGLVDRATLSLPIPADARAEAASFAVSVEPPGGSKTGGPTGPVVYSGSLIKE